MIGSRGFDCYLEMWKKDGVKVDGFGLNCFLIFMLYSFIFTGRKNRIVWSFNWIDNQKM